MTRAALEKKADEFTILGLEGRVSFCDWFVLCDGSNTRQVAAIAENIVETLKREMETAPIGVEGMGAARWVLIDYGDVIVHVFERPLRAYYDIDGLWFDAQRLVPEDLGFGVDGTEQAEAGDPRARAPAS